MSFGERKNLPADHRVLWVSRIEYFGRETIKPECDLSRGFAALLKQRTLTRENIELIKEMGFEVRIKGETL